MATASSSKPGMACALRAIMGVSIAPGHTALTRMPALAYSSAAVFVRPTTAYKAGDLGKDKLTMREVGKIYGATIGCPQLVGTPEQVAGQMEAILDETGGDGFNLTPTVMPNNFKEFVDEVVPILQKRGRHRREYTGDTLRDHLNQNVCG